MGVSSCYNKRMRYTLTVKPGSSREEVRENSPDEMVVYLRAKPHDGEANVALVKLLAKHFKVPKTSIKIINGVKSRRKIIEISS